MTTPQDIKLVVDDIGRDIARFEHTGPPHDETGIACLHQRIQLAENNLAAESWTSDELTKAIRDLKARVHKLEQQ